MWLRSHSVDLVYSVVLSAMLEKLPEDYSEQQVEQAFAANRKLALAEDRSDQFLQALVLVSQRLEKRHTFTSAEVDEALQLLSDFRNIE